MSRKYTLKEVESILRDVILGALEHMEAIKSELRKLDLKQDGSDSPESLARAKVLTTTLVCINDIIHPAHKICYRYFRSAAELFDAYVANHELAVQNKLVPECNCNACGDRPVKKEEDAQS
jgi:hypothetical protein